jgi:FkbM family methyltransferase
MKKILKKIIPASFIEKLKYKKEELFDRKKKRNRKNFYSSIIRDGDTVFDVGANMGNRVEAFVAAGAKVIAIEPQSKCVDHLRKKFSKNNVIVIAKGLGAEVGIKEFYLSDTSTLSTFSTDWINTVKAGRFKEHQWKKTAQIHVTTLDNLIQDYGKPRFIKIDVEGFELEVLKGLTSKVDYLSFEYAIPEYKNRLLECMARVHEISSKVEFNFAVDEDMFFRLDKWKGFDEMNMLVNTDDFNSTGYGDIYCRFN